MPVHHPRSLEVRRECARPHPRRRHVLRPATDAIERADGRSAVACHPDGPPPPPPRAKADPEVGPRLRADPRRRRRRRPRSRLSPPDPGSRRRLGQGRRRGSRPPRRRRRPASARGEHSVGGRGPSADRLTGRVLQFRASPGEELTHLGGSVGRQRREVRRQPRSNELKDALRVFDVLQLVRAEVDELDVGQLLVLYDRRGRPCERRICPPCPAAMTRAARCPAEADVVVVRDRRLTGVHAHPGPTGTARLRARGEPRGLAGLPPLPQRHPWRAERRRRTSLTLRVDLVAVVGRERLTDQAAVLGQNVPVPLAQLPEQTPSTPRRR